jgi:cytoskeleton protein RodZ
MPSFGENLRRERELRGIDLREMAEATKISIRFLQALEQDRVDILPGGIFPRAFVRQYAKYLGLDPDRLVAEFVYAHGGEPIPVKGTRSEVRVDQGPPRGLILIAVVVLILGIVAWKVRGMGPRTPRPASPSVAAPPATTFAQDRVYPPPSGTAASPAPVAPGALVVTVLARRSSWAEARVDGTTVLSRTLKEGESQRLEGRREIVISLGNAGGVSLTLNDKPMPPVGREGEVKRNVVINAQTAPALMAGTVPSPGPGEAATPRPPAPRPASPRPTPTPSPSVLVIAPRPTLGLGSPGLVPPARPIPPMPSPSPR